MHTFYNTGFIHTGETKLRLKQGLLPQNIANVCSSCYSPCNKWTLYPSPVVHMETPPNFPESSPCLHNFRSS